MAADEKAARRVALIAVSVGIAYTIFSEWLNIVIRAAWAYSDLMPVVPDIDTGLSPLLQWTVIPLAAFWRAARSFGQGSRAMLEISGIGIFAAFLAGAISFLSPCVLPLVPGYVSYIAGQPGLRTTRQVGLRSRAQAVGLSTCFILGFSTVFVALGAGASALGSLLLTWRMELNLVGGAIVILFGLVMLGALRVPGLARDTRLQLDVPGGRPLGAYVLGLAFAFGWTPCIGPILGAILTVSANAGKLSDGVWLLSIYSVGLGVPFLLAALFTDAIAARVKRIGRTGRWLYKGAGIVMIVMGLAMMTGQLSRFAYWILGTFPFLARIG